MASSIWVCRELPCSKGKTKMGDTGTCWTRRQEQRRLQGGRPWWWGSEEPGRAKNCLLLPHQPSQWCSPPQNLLQSNQKESKHCKKQSLLLWFLTIYCKIYYHLDVLYLVLIRIFSSTIFFAFDCNRCFFNNLSVTPLQVVKKRKS